MMTQYEKDRDELHKITSNQTKNVIDQNILTSIKEKVAMNTNNSELILADEQYNQSVLTQQNQIQENNEIKMNKSFFKVKNQAQQKIQTEEAVIMKKIDMASQQRQQLAMEREDKLSYKYEMQCLSDLFKERF